MSSSQKALALTGESYSSNRDASPVSFSKLKKDLLFHEKRLQLLGSRVVEDLESHLIEKTLSRQECRADCRAAIAAFETGAADAKLSGRWDEYKVATLFGLEVPLDLVVGSSRFQAPAAADTMAIGHLVGELQVIGRRFPEFTSDNGDETQKLEALTQALQEVEWGARDVARMKEAVSAKVAILTDLNDLSNELQSSAFEVSMLTAKVEDLRRREERAIEEGEMAVCDSLVREKLNVLASIIDTLQKQSDRIDKAEEVNVTKRKSNIAVFQGASAMLQVLKTEKQGFIEGCQRDIARIHRGVEYEDKATGSSRRKTRQELDASLARINDLDKRQEFLSNRLLEIFRDFQETEIALEKVGQERSKAVAEHVELVEDSRHIISDMVELSQFADVHAKNLEVTYREYLKGLSGLECLDQILLQKKGFDNYDFNAAARRLTSMHHTTASQINRELNNFEVECTALLRKQQAKLRALDEESDLIKCELEIRREVFDPQTKKYVVKLRELETQRAELVKDTEELKDRLEEFRNVCMPIVCRHLSQTEIESVEERTTLDSLQRREDLLDMKQTLLEPTSAEVVGERAKLLVDRQAQIQQRATSPAKTIRDKSSATGTGASSTNLVPAPSKTSALPAASSGSSSKVLSVREEVERSKKLLDQLEKEAKAANQKYHEEEEQAAKAKAEAESKGRVDSNGKRRIRVISQPQDEMLPPV